MSAKLDIEYIEIKNFLSYGDYLTKLNVASRGPTLILGDVDGSDVSNGAGKSSLLSAFIWCLFGRTIPNRAPGDKVINWYTGKNCSVKIGTTNGWEIVRTRKTDGHSELVVSKDGADLTKSTNTNAQAFLQEAFGLDYEIFTSSVFCGQFGKAFLEMPPAKRKDAVERLLGLDKLNSYADLAKTEFQKAENNQSISRAKIELLQNDLSKQEVRLAEAVRNKKEYEDQRAIQVENLVSQIGSIEKSISEIEIPNISKLKEQWDAVGAIRTKLSGYQNKIDQNEAKQKLLGQQVYFAEESLSEYVGWPYDVDVNIEELKKKHLQADKASEAAKKLGSEIEDLQLEIKSLQLEVNQLSTTIEDWENKKGTSCPYCKQDVCGDHVENTIKPQKEQLTITKENVSEITKQVKLKTEIYIKLNGVQAPEMSLEEAERLTSLNEKIAEEIKTTTESIVSFKKEIEELQKENVGLTRLFEDVSKKLSVLTPTISLVDAQKVVSKVDVLNQKKKSLSERVGEVKTTENPYRKIELDIFSGIKSAEEDIQKAKEEISHLDVLFSHYKYIYRSYSDRRKIKKWLLSELIPFLNDRVHYYLGALDIEMDISFTATLDTETSKWGYDFCSGGERKRIDLAIMFGLYDLYTSIYGQQCNIMVLDEVDSRLDKRGVESFSDIVNSFRSDHPMSIFVISHKDELRDLFPSQVTIKKRNGFSIIDQT